MCICCKKTASGRQLIP